MRPSPEGNSDRPLNLQEAIERTAGGRASYTRAFLNKIGKSTEQFQNEVALVIPEVSIEFDDDRSLSLAVFELQKALGFPMNQSGLGCDAMFGPYTNRKLKERLLRSGQRNLTREVGDESLKELTKIEPADVKAAVSEGRELEPVSLSESVFIGDSLTVGMKPFIEGAYSLYKGAKQTGWMLAQFLNFLKEKREGLHPNAKRIVVMGGFNDISSTKGAAHVIKNLQAMFAAAKQAGLEVVACTIPNWHEKKLHAIWVERWKNRGWGKVKGVYPYSPEELAAQTVEINNWIIKQQGGLVDMVVDVHGQRFEMSGDGVHRTRKGYRDMANFLKEKANIA